MNDHREFLLKQLRKSNEALTWWEDMLFNGNIVFTSEED
jgi:hypothetical protein